MGVEMQQLRCVVAVAEECSFTRAAARLHVAQPSVSSQIRGLERELGAELFHRTRHSVEVSPAGAAFLPWARQALADCESGRAVVRELLGLRRGQLRLGATPSLTGSLLPVVLTRFHHRYPGVELTLHQAGSRDLVARLEEGLLDLALVILPVDSASVHTLALAEEELVLAVLAGHRLARRRSVTVADLRDEPLVMFREGYDLREVTLAACQAAGFRPTLAAQGGEMDGVLALAGGGLGAAVLPGSVIPADGPLRAVRFAGHALVRTIALARRRDRPTPRAAQAFEAELTAALAPGGWTGPFPRGLRPSRSRTPGGRAVPSNGAASNG